ncbi:hypothetical protein E2C01_057443 [Portunus trituberculatus]|uniref:Uncharacterized protein n=1 Tax=Portunus trituberculatus TaxID=210409 RepID=A0A5B7H124_PORTR|nr:hypothetical protein [Portunus trituberculatus]
MPPIPPHFYLDTYLLSFTPLHRHQPPTTLITTSWQLTQYGTLTSALHHVIRSPLSVASTHSVYQMIRHIQV